jgi:hypothetical protein
VVPRLDQPLVDFHVQAELGRERRGGLQRTLQRGGPQHGHVPAGQEPGGGLGHEPALLGQVVAREPAVEHTTRVAYIAMAQQVDDGGVRHGPLSLPGAGRGPGRPTGMMNSG